MKNLLPFWERKIIRENEQEFKEFNEKQENMRLNSVNSKKKKQTNKQTNKKTSLWIIYVTMYKMK